LTSSQNLKLAPEFTLFVKFSPKTRELTTNIFKDVIKIIVPKSVKFKHYLKKGFANFSIDAFDVKKMVLYEFYGDHWHGNPKTLHKFPEEAKLLYELTMEREMILKLLGFSMVTVWEDDWKEQMNKFSDECRNELIQYVSDNHIDPRRALHGGRTECFKT
jgi:hypothetical protein